MASQQKILIVDDEKNIVLGLQQILQESGYAVCECREPIGLIKFIREKKPDVVLLDVWMPGVDCRSLLKEIKKKFPLLSVIIMSGHLNAEGSADLMRLGASMFVEKPFGADVIISKIQQVLSRREDGDTDDFREFKNKFFQKDNDYQKTISSSVLAKGTGVHTGQNTGVILSPMPEDTGIIFEDIASGAMMPAFIDYVFSSQYSTNLKKGNFELRVVEHLLAALHAYGITNIKIKASKEIPILDGSAKPFCELIEKAGVEIQKKKKENFSIDKKFSYRDEKDSSKFIEIKPYDGLIIDYTLFMSKEFGSQHACLEFPKNKVDFFLKEIALCRTFGFLTEAKYMQNHGFAKGANLGNALLLHENRVINSKLFFENEFARHKILDILGDFFLMGGRELKGHIVAKGTGHRHNHVLLKAAVGAGVI